MKAENQRKGWLVTQTDRTQHNTITNEQDTTQKQDFDLGKVEYRAYLASKQAS